MDSLLLGMEFADVDSLNQPVQCCGPNSTRIHSKPDVPPDKECCGTTRYLLPKNPTGGRILHA